MEGHKNAVLFGAGWISSFALVFYVLEDSGSEGGGIVK